MIGDGRYYKRRNMRLSKRDQKGQAVREWDRQMHTEQGAQLDSLSLWSAGIGRVIKKAVPWCNVCLRSRAGRSSGLRRKEQSLTKVWPSQISGALF